MVPVYIKGGAWTNIEDQILKAAVTKYGLNQWSRVASLLAKKTAKQCKARWQEYLDPRIDTTDWTPQEDERLLNIARLRPNQWRSIAQSIGRTATACVERYQKLLSDGADEEGEEGEGGAAELGLTGVGVETLKAVGASVDLKLGDLNVNPETKEARPDGDEFDDDEREMLAEAKARLANSKGKKAMRKARERMLEESKRVSVLQKRRELKEAGVNIKLNAPKKKFANQFDYNADIPFEHRPQEGPYDTLEEQEGDVKRLEKFEKGMILHGLKEKDDSIDKKKKKKKKRSAEEVDDKPQTELKDDLYKRRKLNLSKPLFSQEELVELSSKSEEEIKTVLQRKNTELGLDVESNISHQVELIKRGQNFQSALLAESEDEENVQDQDQMTVQNDEDEFTTQTTKAPLSVRERLAALPKPKNDFEIAIDSEEEIEEQESEAEKKILKQQRLKIDEGERLRLLQQKREEETQLALLRRSQSVQRNLPIPFTESNHQFQNSDKDSPLDSLILRELKNLVRSDFAKANKLNNIPLVTDLDQSSFDKIHELIRSEINAEDLTQFQTQFINAHRSKGMTPVKQSSLVTELQTLVSQTTKIESKLQKQQKGYMMLNDKLSSQNVELLTELKDLDRTQAAFEMLAQGEEISMKLRQDWLSEATEKLLKAERDTKEIYLEMKRADQVE
ncbi:hypothetical protein WICPIJ_000004 [Wickerhamomyces pijperi]|uniref:Pre-mRNA-splicing factor CEF1 n=1 Tax=Wickerhamomyces pijperi TaxID=599730 RepID=A0A9P8QI10_WICPI|nr:hypothetical protein WICPIJ_000004 [Wickerhamomyces pijperi]